MELINGYLISQIFITINYFFMAISYYSKNRKRILFCSLISILTVGTAYIILHAWSGLAMCLVSLIRNIIFEIDVKKNGESKEINKKDIIILIVLYVMIIASAIITYDGIFSLLSIIATMLFTYSVWQKNTITYKILGVPNEVIWILYNIYIKSLFSVILEIILLACCIIGYMIERKEKNKLTNIFNNSIVHKS